MTFNKFFTPKEKMELLERWILVMSYVYYELNDNIASDFSYDNNANQLFSLMEEYPDEFKQTRYYPFLVNYEVGCTSGFELISNVYKNDPDLYNRIAADAKLALKIKRGLNEQQNYNLVSQLLG